MAAATVEGVRQRALLVDGGEVLECDGLAVCLTNLPVNYLNAAMWFDEPVDARSAVAAADDVFRERGHPFFGLELEVGRSPLLEKAVQEAGLERLQQEPALAATVSEIVPTPIPDGMSVQPVLDDAALAAAGLVDAEAFGTDPGIAKSFPGPGLLSREDAVLFLAWWQEEPVGQVLAWRLEDTVGIFGMGVREHARRRGLGSALTALAAHAFDDVDLAWLQATEASRGAYERLGFRHVSDWEVWGRLG